MSDNQIQVTDKAAPTRRLAGKVAIVTGANSGIGEATARELSQLGVSVLVVGS